jgi:hypothetical protein
MYYEGRRIFDTNLFVNHCKLTTVMKQQINATRMVLLLAIVVVTIGFSAFRQKDSAHQKTFRDGYSSGDEDTTTRRKRDKFKDEFNMDELVQGMKKLDEQMLELNKQMKSLDFTKMQKEIDDEMKKVDFDKIGKEIDDAMKKIDWEQMRSELKKSSEEMKKIDISDMKKQMEQVKEQLKKEKMNLNIDGEKIRQQVEAGMEKAKEGMAKAKEEMASIKLFIDELEKDGLIDTNKPFKVEVKDGELYLNGTKQSKEVNDKYRSSIKKGNFSVNNNPDERKGTSI